MSIDRPLTRSRTSERSWDLRVFSGREGMRARMSSVSGGRCLMK